MLLLKQSILVLLFTFSLGKNLSVAQIQHEGKKALIEIEDAIIAGDVSKLSEYLSDKTYFSFTSDLTGYFSYSQVYNLLKDYFGVYSPIKFRFMSKSGDGNTPFGWGEYIYLKNGIRGSHKIFISLEKSGPNFYISQISIN